MTKNYLYVLLQVLIYDCIISGDIYVRRSQISRMEECACRPQLLINVYTKMKAFELTQTTNDLFPVVEFESEGWEKYASITTLNDVEVRDAKKRVQVGEKVDAVIDAVVELYENICTIEVSKRNVCSA